MLDPDRCGTKRFPVVKSNPKPTGSQIALKRNLGKRELLTFTFQRSPATRNSLDVKATGHDGEASDTPSFSDTLVAGHHRPYGAFALIPLFYVFIFLQVLDALTTVGVLQRGGYEANPIVNRLMDLGPVNGLLIAKLLVVVGGAAILWNGRQRVLFIANYIYAGIICWNLIALVSAA